MGGAVERLVQGWGDRMLHGWGWTDWLMEGGPAGSGMAGVGVDRPVHGWGGGKTGSWVDGGRVDGLVDGWGVGWFMDGGRAGGRMDGPAGGERQAVGGWTEAAKEAPGENQGAEPGSGCRDAALAQQAPIPSRLVSSVPGLLLQGKAGDAGVLRRPRDVSTAGALVLTPTPVCRALWSGVRHVGVGPLNA